MALQECERLAHLTSYCLAMDGSPEFAAALFHKLRANGWKPGLFSL